MKIIIYYGRIVILSIITIIFIGYLVTGLEILIKSYSKIGFNLNEQNKEVYAVLAIIFASQVAGFAVLLTIVKNHFTEKEKEEKGKQNAIKSLDSYLDYFNELANEQLVFIDWIIKYIKQENTKTLKELELERLFFSDIINESAFLKPIENMLDKDVQKYYNKNTIDFILNTKREILTIIHHIQLIKTILIPNNKQNEIFQLLIDMREKIARIKEDLKVHKK
ncbi:hypothetical protein ACOTV4_11985 [Aliarcobacter butzleri]